MAALLQPTAAARQVQQPANALTCRAVATSFTAAKNSGWWGSRSCLDGGPEHVVREGGMGRVGITGGGAPGWSLRAVESVRLGRVKRGNQQGRAAGRRGVRDLRLVGVRVGGRKVRRAAAAQQAGWDGTATESSQGTLTFSGGGVRPMQRGQAGGRQAASRQAHGRCRQQKARGAGAGAAIDGGGRQARCLTWTCASTARRPLLLMPGGGTRRAMVA